MTGRLLTAAVAIGDGTLRSFERRQRFLAVIADLTNSHAGFWSWGLGTPKQGTMVPAAIIDFGMTDQQRLGLMSFGTSREMKDVFQTPVLERMGSNSHVATIRQQLFSDSSWDGTGYLQKEMARCGWGEWLHCLRYDDHGNWCAFLLLRNLESDPFCEMDRVIAEISITSIPWLHAPQEDSIPADRLVELSPRQKTVMFMLLDGVPRKTIAMSLGITEDTVGDHIKAIYSHFSVKSAMELAAVFLRSK